MRGEGIQSGRIEVSCRHDFTTATTGQHGLITIQGQTALLVVRVVTRCAMLTEDWLNMVFESDFHRIFCCERDVEYR